MSLHPLINFELQKYYQIKSRLNDVYSRKNLPKVKDGTYVINLDNYKSIGAYWIALHVIGDNVGASNDTTYFDSFGVGNFSKKNKYSLDIKIIQKNDSIMCGYFPTGFIDFMLKGKSFLGLYQFILS